MKINDIRELLNREPFEPFRVILGSRKEYQVVNPGLVALGEATFIIYEAKSDRHSILRLNQITSADVRQAA